MNIQDFLSYVKDQQVPPAPPNGATSNGFGRNFDPQQWRSQWEAREICTKLGMWAIVDQVWTKVLADWIGDRRVLEIMAGGGWLAKALNGHGVSVVATDDFSWGDAQHKEMLPVYPIQKKEAIEAIKTIPADILLVSWPPYGDGRIVEACDVWGVNRPIVYIGEHDGGCNAPEEFFENFQEIEGKPSIPLMSWDGIHDYVSIGYWGRSYAPPNKSL